MTPKEAFEAWWESLPDNGVDGKHWRWVNGVTVHKTNVRIGWLACSAHYEREIEAVAAGVEKQPGKSTGVEIANLLRSRFPKGGE